MTFTSENGRVFSQCSLSKRQTFLNQANTIYTLKPYGPFHLRSTLLPWIGVCSALLTMHARGAVYYWDPEATSIPNGANLAGSWNTNAEWSTSSSQTASPTNWVSGNVADFSAGTTTVTTPFTASVNSAITIAGIYNGANSLSAEFVTLSGTGSLNLAAGVDPFLTTGSDGGTTTVDVPLTGPGQVALEGSNQLYLNATNTFTGGISLGYQGGSAFTGTLNFNNASAFGTGPITTVSTGNAGSFAVEGTSPLSIANSVTTSNVNLNIVGNRAGLTFTGPWTLNGTTIIGCGGNGNIINISGAIGGTGGMVKSNSSTLVLSGPNTFNGGMTVLSGTLSITADNNLGAVPNPAYYDLILSGGTLNASNTFTINPNRLISLTANSTIGVSTGNTLTYAGAIIGSSVLSKSGAGTLILTGASGYTGITQISGGTLEADCQNGSATGTNSLVINPGTTLSGIGLVSGAVSGPGNIAPGTPAGPATLTLGNGLRMTTGGTYVWSLASNSTTGGFSSISLIGGNLSLGGLSTLSINMASAANAPDFNNPFWQTQEAWTIISLNGSAGNSNSAAFGTIVNGAYAAGNFTNYVSGGNIVLLYQPNFAAFDALYDSGPGFFGGENLILTNFSGLNLYAWSTTNANLSVSNWFLEGQMTEQSLAPALPGYSRYTINVTPSASPTYYAAGNINTGPFIISPVPATILTTPDYSDFTVNNTNVPISADGVLGLLPAPPIILPGSIYSTGQFQLQFSAATNQTFIVQGSTDLINWTNLGCGLITNSPMSFMDTAASNYPVQFYRIELSAEP